MENWAQRIREGDVRALARAATAIENRAAEGEALLRELFGETGRALVLGVTGPAGAGKSTLIDQLVRVLRGEGKKVGVLAVDPSSPFTGGAILGDRIRMQAHHGDPGVFIRSVATRGWTGGVARATMDLALLLDAAGREVVIVETVGVGQDEVDVARLCDVTVVVLAPGMGDDVQAIKAGLMEIADVFVVNKADQPGAERLVREIQGSEWTAPVVMTEATEGTGAGEVLTAVRACRRVRRVGEAWVARLREIVRERLLERIPEEMLREAAAQIARRERDPYSAVEDILNYSCFKHHQERSH